MRSKRPSGPPFWPVVRGVFWGYAGSYFVLLVVAIFMWLIGLPPILTGASLHVWLWGFTGVGGVIASALLAALVCLPCATLVRHSVQVRVQQELSFVATWACVAGVGLPIWMLDERAAWVASTLLTAAALCAVGSVAVRPRVGAHVTRALVGATCLLAFVPVLAWGWVHPYSRSGSGGLSAGGPVAVDAITIGERSPLSVSVTAAKVSSQSIHGLTLTNVRLRRRGSRADVVLSYRAPASSCGPGRTHHAHVRQLWLRLKTPLGHATQLVPIDETVDLRGCGPKR